MLNWRNGTQRTQRTATVATYSVAFAAYRCDRGVPDYAIQIKNFLTYAGTTSNGSA
jgi:hypothetical protein